MDAARPCVWSSCLYHLAYDVLQSGSIKENFPNFELEDLPETCALDVADAGGVTLERAGVLTNLTRERIRQIEVKALRKLKRRGVNLLQLLPDGHRADVGQRKACRAPARGVAIDEARARRHLPVLDDQLGLAVPDDERGSR